MKKFKVLKELVAGDVVLEVGAVLPEVAFSVFSPEELEGAIEEVIEEELPEASEEELPEGAEEYNGPMVLVKFIADYEVVDETNEKTGEIIKVGEEHEVPEPVVKGLVDGGFVEVVSTNETVPVVEEVIAEEVKYYKGKVVVSDMTREVNGKEYKHVRLEDGTEYDLTEEDYKNEVKSLEK